MAWELIEANLALRELARGASGLDVRSPGEFARGSIHGFANAPILNDERRHLVGLAYKKQGQERAIELGHQLVEPDREAMIQQWSTMLSATHLPVVTCWRGGLRSKIAAEWLSQAGLSGVRVHGGYKKMRQVLLEELSRSRDYLVVCGLTGSGKTCLLRDLPSVHVLDLEGAANHRGSAFGWHLRSPQPSQQEFENRLGFALFQSHGPVVAENEGNLVGICAVPEPLRVALKPAKRVRLLARLEERSFRIFQEYIEEPWSKYSREEVLKAMESSLLRIKKSLGGLDLSQILNQLHEAFQSNEPKFETHQGWIEALLKRYYDPKYNFSQKRDAFDVIFEGTFDEVRHFLQNYLGRGRA
ncbi:MAG: tRNA 2-selenouridine(34) synthase MnmH [Bdellovibrionales bacterium]